MEVGANSEECFFDKVKAGTKLGLTFEVAEGGFLDIDVRIMGPDAKPIHQVQIFILTRTNMFIIDIRKGDCAVCTNMIR